MPNSGRTRCFVRGSSRSVAAVIMLFVGLATASAADEKVAEEAAAKDVFKTSKVYQVQITLSASEFAAMAPIARGGFFGAPAAAAPEQPTDTTREMHRNRFGMDLPWTTGSVTVDDQVFENVGIRYKGNGTIGDASRAIKKSIKIDLDHFGGVPRFYGRKTINLHCGVTDPSKCRETLGYQLYRAAGVPAPRTAFAEVWLNVPEKHDKAPLGLYTVVEQPDRLFLEANFGSDKGLLMKPEGLRDFVDLGDDWSKYKQQYEPKRDATDAEAARLIAFARLVDKADDEEFGRDVGKYLEIDNYLRFLAVTAYIANSDSFFGLGHNFYMYLHPDTGKLRFIPWDVDRAFANFPIFGSKNQQMDFSLSRPYAGAHKLTERLLAIPSVNEQYQKLLNELSSTCFARATLMQQVQELESFVKEPVERDTKAAIARQDGVAGFGPFAMMGRPPELKTFVEKRTKSVSAQLAGTSPGHIPAGGFGPGAFKFGDFLSGPILETLDDDKNETLSRTEWLAGAKRLFDASEKDADQLVTDSSIAAGLNSLFPKPPEGTPSGPGNFSLGGIMSGPLVKRADTNDDSKLSLAELQATAEKLYEEYDKRKSGEVNETEFGQLLNVLFPTPNFGPPPPPRQDNPAN